MKPILIYTSLLFLFSCASRQQQPLMITGVAGTYTSGSSHGIYTFRLNTNTGAITLADSVEAVNPSYLTVSHDRNYLYAVHETGRPGGGAVASYSFDRHIGRLQQVDRQSSEGDHPCYIAIDREGKALFAGNYSSGTVAMYALGDAGKIGKATAVVHHEGHSVHTRQQSPHVHATVISPDRNYLLVPDLGIDAVKIYRIKEASLEEQPPVKVSPGSGPRHLRFHPNGRWAYLINELSGSVHFYTYEEGRLQLQQEATSLPQGYSGRFTSADIRVHPSGNFLYVSNRDDLNAIAIFHIDAYGRLSPRGHQPVPGKTPRHFNFDPSGQFLLVAHQSGGGIAVFRVNGKTGALTDTGHRLHIDKPVCIDWL